MNKSTKKQSKNAPADTEPAPESPTTLDYAMLDEIRDAGMSDLESMHTEAVPVDDSKPKSFMAGTPIPVPPSRIDTSWVESIPVIGGVHILSYDTPDQFADADKMVTDTSHVAAAVIPLHQLVALKDLASRPMGMMVWDGGNNADIFSALAELGYAEAISGSGKHTRYCITDAGREYINTDTPASAPSENAKTPDSVVLDTVQLSSTVKAKNAPVMTKKERRKQKQAAIRQQYANRERKPVSRKQPTMMQLLSQAMFLDWIAGNRAA